MYELISPQVCFGFKKRKGKKGLVPN